MRRDSSIFGLTLALVIVALACCFGIAALYAQSAGTIQDFDRTYWLSQPPAVRAIQSASDKPALAFKLASEGFKIDAPIMVWGWSPCLVMKMRADYGYTWVPSLLQPPVSIAPGLGAPGSVPYDPAKPPAGSIKVSTEIADYPPFDPPVVKPVDPKVDPVLGQIVPGSPMFHVAAWYEGADGDKVSNARGTFILHQSITPFGRSRYWEKVS